MGLIQNLIRKYKDKKTRYSDLEENYRLQKQLDQRQLSSNERELNRYNDEYRQRWIAQRLQQYRKKQMDEWWHGHQILNEKNIFKNSKNIFKNQKRIFSK